MEKNPYVVVPHFGMDERARAVHAVAWELGKLRELLAIPQEEESDLTDTFVKLAETNTAETADEWVKAAVQEVATRGEQETGITEDEEEELKDEGVKVIKVSSDDLTPAKRTGY